MQYNCTGTRETEKLLSQLPDPVMLNSIDLIAIDAADPPFFFWGGDRVQRTM